MEYKVADLPTLDSQIFMSWLEKHVCAEESAGECPASCRNQHGGCVSVASSQIVDAMWCYYQTYTNPSSFLPCCAIVTTTKLYIHALSPLPHSSDNMSIPELQFHLALPLDSIQHVVVGPCYAYIRVEEAFVGAVGLFTLFALERSVMKRFSESLQDCCTELDPDSPLDILDLLCQSELLTKVCHREKSLGLVCDYLLFTLLVRVTEEDNVRSCLLVMSRHAVYCIDASCVYSTPATFQSTREGELPITILEEFSIKNHIVDITQCLPQKIFSDNANGADFAPVPTNVHIQCNGQERQLTFLFSTTSSQDSFLRFLHTFRPKQTSQGVPQHKESHDVADSADSSTKTCDSDVNNSGSVSAEKTVVPPVKTGVEMDADLAIHSETNENKNCKDADKVADMGIVIESGVKEESIDPAPSEAQVDVALENRETDSDQFPSCHEEVEKAATSLTAGKTDQQENNAVLMASDIESRDTVSDSQSKNTVSDSQSKDTVSDVDSGDTVSDSQYQDTVSDVDPGDSQSKDTVSESQSKDTVFDSQSNDTVSDSQSKDTVSDSQSNSKDTVSDSQSKDTLSDSQSKDTVSDSQSKDTVSDSQSKDTVSDSQSKDTVSDSQSNGTVSDSQSKDTLSDSQSKDTVSDSQSNGTVSDSQSKDTVSDSQSKDTVSDSQSKDIVSDSQSKDTVSDSKSNGTVSDSQSKDIVSDSQSKDTVFDSHYKDTVSDSQSKDTVSDSQSKDTVSDSQSKDTVSDSQSNGTVSDSQSKNTVSDSQSKATV